MTVVICDLITSKHGKHGSVCQRPNTKCSCVNCAVITTTALINAILQLCIQIQLKCTIVSKVTSHAKDEGKKEAKARRTREQIAELTASRGS
jgi:hypothetical protein